MDQTFGPAITLDITNVTGQISARSGRIYRHDAEVFARFLLDQGLTMNTLSLLTRSHMIAYRKYLGDAYAKATAARMFSVARRILQEYVYGGILPTNPAAGIKTFPVANETPYTTLEKDEAQALLKTIDTTKTKGKRDYAILSLLLRTGLRRSECCALNLEDLKQEQGHTMAMIEHGKGDKRGIVKVPVDVVRAIDVYLEAAGRSNVPPSAPLFVGFDRGDHVTAARVSDKLLERLVKQAGRRIGMDISPHCLRASFITLTSEGGAQLEQVQYASRHADPRTTQRYRKRKLNLDDNAVDYLKL
jgi:integrase/recombinase XerD